MNQLPGQLRCVLGSVEDGVASGHCYPILSQGHNYLCSIKACKVPALPGGNGAGQIAEAQGMTSVAEHPGIPRESVCRALSPRGNPTRKTLLALLNATGLRLWVHA